MRLVDADALKEDFDIAFFNDYDDYKKALRLIDNAPTVEMNALPKIHYDRGFNAGYDSGKNDRPKGKWVECEYLEYKCSVCGRHITLEDHWTNLTKDFPFCHCGAKMKGGKE